MRWAASQAISVFMQPGQVRSKAQLLAKQLAHAPRSPSVIGENAAARHGRTGKMQGFSGALQTLDNNPLPYVLQVQPRTALSAGRSRISWRRRARDAQASIMVQDSGTGAAAGCVARRRQSCGADSGWRCWRWRCCWWSATRCAWTSPAAAEEIGVLLLVGASGAVRASALSLCRHLVRPVQRHPGGGCWRCDRICAGRPVAQLSQVYDGKLQVGGLPPWLLLAVPVAAAALGWLGARLVSAWQLRKAA
jgi:cell division transport system permease protein